MTTENIVRMSEIFELGNIRLALADLSDKKDTAGLDGMYLSDLSDYLLLNPDWCRDVQGALYYRCGQVREYVILTKNKKKRAIYQFNALDRLVARATEQVLEKALEPLLSDQCYSYREGKGLLDALSQMRDFINAGYDTMLEFDIDDYFESILHKPLLHNLGEIVDEQVLALIKSFIKATIVPEDERLPFVKRKGLITGSAISPILSNFYLREFDEAIDQMGIRYVRYGDDYFLFFKEEGQALLAWKNLEALIWDYGLTVNKRKSGIYSPFRKRVLGYYFTKTKQGIVINRPPSERAIFDNWQTDKISAIDPKFDIISDGILTQQHWNLLFDGEKGKVHLPTNVTDYINVYSEVMIDSRVIELLSQRGIRVNIMDKFGEKLTTIEPANTRFELSTVQKQLMVYQDEDIRFAVAREMEQSILHNMRSVIRYYAKRRSDKRLITAIRELSDALAQLDTASSINDLLMIEARAKQDYFVVFNSVVQVDDFLFTKRTRRPPKDALNAMISFGNVFLYNYISSLIYRSPLDIRFSFLHSASRRSESLQLDIADIFKPILVDRTIFSLINRQEIRLEKHFEEIEINHETGVYLNAAGKRIFLRALKEKLRTVITVHERKLRYSDVMRAEVYKLNTFLREGTAYKGYRYTT